MAVSSKETKCLFTVIDDRPYIILELVEEEMCRRSNVRVSSCDFDKLTKTRLLSYNN